MATTTTKPQPTQAPARAPATAPATNGKPKRQRAALSPVKRLAVLVAGLTAILARPDIRKMLTAAEHAAVTAATQATKELNAKTIEPIKIRIAAIQAEFTALVARITEPDAADKAKELSIEPARIQRKYKTPTED